jgi:hypothetical protein
MGRKVRRSNCAEHHKGDDVHMGTWEVGYRDRSAFGRDSEEDSNDVTLAELGLPEEHRGCSCSKTKTRGCILGL